MSTLDPNKDDLPLMANTNYMLVRHYVLDVALNFDKKVFSGTAVLFLEARRLREKVPDASEVGRCCESRRIVEAEPPGSLCDAASSAAAAACASADKTSNLPTHSAGRVTDINSCHHGNDEWASGISGTRERCSDGEDFVLVLDCCDLVVRKVEEVDVTAVAGTEKLIAEARDGSYCPRRQGDPRNDIVHKIISLAAERWREQHHYYLQGSHAPGCGELQFHTDMWCLKIRKPGIQTPEDFPHALKIWYETKADGASVRWTQDQSYRPCVYTVGSPINNRALFPCQEPPVAMATWQASVWAPKDSVVLMSGENCAEPHHGEGLSKWFYYVTMPMPASTFTIAVGYWVEANSSFSSQVFNPLPASSACENDNCSVSQLVCGHTAYPCRFQSIVAQGQDIIPHRVFTPRCLKLKCEEVLFPLVARCLSAAHRVLGTHPFSRLDVLIVPASFSSLGMASPHIIFLSQSVLSGKDHLCGVRLCHEVAHAWFGLAIGARDWTEEWISEGFATYLEDVLWADAQKLPEDEADEQQQLKSLLRWRRLRDEVQNSEEELQVLRPNKENTGQVSDSGATVVKHGLNPGKIFMQVHYLKGYFVLQHLESRIGQKAFLKFFRLFVKSFHGQLILSQDFLHMLMENFPHLKTQGLSSDAVYRDWLDVAGLPKVPGPGAARCGGGRLSGEARGEVTKWVQINQRDTKGGRKRKRKPEDEVAFRELLPDQLVLLLELLLEVESLSFRTLKRLQKHYCLREQDAEVCHRWCELVVKHKNSAAYGDVEHFLQHHQAMGVYLYGELMVGEDARQQKLARKCFAMLQEEMDQSSQKVVAEMIF
ncbi:aminopeptidase O isoform X1 [Callorhinchus milii]|uniref:aminopeptidase O isoform X1 n=1 Tax=Callorhinchus milii TaxID=7868 RepID=UPI001C3FBEB8|nr:aminopeptidase O isoform X1 [Callorhinchus milii]